MSVAEVGGVEVRRGVPISTWFGIGGHAARFAVPRSVEELRVLLAIDPRARVLGDGANLLVDDEGVEELVLSLGSPAFTQCEESGFVSGLVSGLEGGVLHVRAGVHLFKLINQTTAAGLGGLEVLAGIPATLGGAIVMNAGGTYGQISDVVERVYALTRDGRDVVLERGAIDFGYRKSGLHDLIITAADLRLVPGDAAALVSRKKEINDFKLRSQPMSAHSAGCCFKNPTLSRDVPELGRSADGRVLGVKGARVSAGLIIDRAGLKGMAIGGARVSEQHANFITVDKEHAKARDVIALMELITRRVMDTFGIVMEREVVVWGRA
jgi:UDP-N-acetylmuramate dehydrogenase